MTAVIIAIIADSVVFELASRRVAAGVIAARLGAAAIAVLARFDDAVAALVAGDGGDAFVVGEARAFDAVAAHGRADVADSAGGELCYTLTTRGRVHDVLGAGVAGAGAEGTALLGVYDCSVAAGL